jgi:dipicolinate synthase subunit B
LQKDTPVYELASEPYGFDWGCYKASDFDYKIEPALPGRFYPNMAAAAVHNAIKRFFMAKEQKPSIVLCITGSSCSYLKLLPVLEQLVEKYDVIPCLSANADQPNRFTNIDEFKRNLKQMTGNNLITHIAASELLSANKRVVASVVFPATGNTIAKLANAVTDTPVTMAVKALLRNSKPCIVGISTNDALSGQAENIGKLLARKNYYFVPFSQDDHVQKPFSMVCDFSKVSETIDAALQGKQLQPIIV